MNLTDKYVDIANAIRKQYGTTDKYYLADMPTLIDNLEIKNYFTEGQSYDSTVDTAGWKPIKGADIATWNSLSGKTVNISFDIEWSGIDVSTGTRAGIEYGIAYKNNPPLWTPTFIYFSKASGTAHVAQNFTLPQDEVTGYDEGDFYAPNTAGAKVKITNAKLVVNPLGGLNKPNLFDSHLIKLYNTERQGTLFTFDCKVEPIGDLNFVSQLNMQLQKGASYKISFYATGSGSIITFLFGNTDTGKYVDNGQVINLSSGWKKYEQIISSDNVPIPASFNFRARGVCHGKVAELELTEI